MNQIVMREGEELFTTSEVIAQQSGVQHKNILQNLDNNLEHFEEFGRVLIEKEPLYTNGGLQIRRIARLNEQQATLMLTFLRNTPQVMTFKKALVRAFFEMAKQLNTPAVMSEEELIATALVLANKRIERVDKALAVAAPKVEAYDEFISSDGTYAVGDVAKMLGIGQNTFFEMLRNAGVLISKGSKRNTPYSDFMQYFELKAETYKAPNGSRSISRTTRVKPAGIDFIRRKLNLTGPAAQVSLTK